jgi:hypothetical protein
MFYKALGFVAWKGARWYARRKAPSRQALAGGAVGLGLATLAAVGASRHEH